MKWPVVNLVKEMIEPLEIIKFLEKYFFNINNNKRFKALVTAGPTREYRSSKIYI